MAMGEQITPSEQITPTLLHQFTPIDKLSAPTLTTKWEDFREDIRPGERERAKIERNEKDMQKGIFQKITSASCHIGIIDCINHSAILTPYLAVSKIRSTCDRFVAISTVGRLS